MRLPAMRSVMEAAWLLAIVPPVPAHVGPHRGGTRPAAPRDWHELWHSWGSEPGVIIPLVLSGVLYALGVRKLWRDGSGRGVRRWEAAAFAGGWLALVVALV